MASDLQMTLPLEDNDNQNEANRSTCCTQLNSRHDPIETLHSVAMISILVGMVLCMGAFFYPRDSNYFDPDLPAEEMESIEQEYARLEDQLDIVVVIGTVFVATGGLIIAGIIMFMLFRGDFKMYFSDKERDGEKFSLTEAGPVDAQYGSAASGYGMTSDPVHN